MLPCRVGVVLLRRKDDLGPIFLLTLQNGEDKFLKNHKHTKEGKSHDHRGRFILTALTLKTKEGLFMCAGL